MEEIEGLSSNHLRVASTFAGCGGSSLGYRMASYEMIWANEFDVHAAECYELNSSVKVDKRDIREVQSGDILKACNLRAGELDVLDGSPPCQSFSTAGKRQMTDPRSDLFFEYARLLRGLQPKVFVAENVSGLLKGVAKGMFKLILAELKSCGYRVSCRLLDAQWLGVPQRRQRVIFIGVREDSGLEPAFPMPLPYRYSVRDACPWIGNAKWDPKGQFMPTDVMPTDVMPTITGEAAHQWDVAPSQVLFSSGGRIVDQETLNTPSPSVTATQCRIDDVDPVDEHFPPAVERELDNQGTFGAIRAADADRVCPTVQTVPHNTPLRSERRKFTIAELRRICSYPDDFKLTGSYAKQWARLGNSVPPVMMRHIAGAIKTGIFDRLGND
jgi:DNA (cytosine-5)-methyltransferase 1